MTEQEKPVGPLGGPITVEAIVDHALASTELPPRGEATLETWLEQFTGVELPRRLAELVRYARIGDVATARHWAHQADLIYRKPT